MTSTEEPEEGVTPLEGTEQGGGQENEQSAENGKPTSTTVAPAPSNARRQAAVVSRSGKPAGINGTRPMPRPRDSAKDSTIDRAAAIGSFCRSRDDKQA